MKELLQSLGPVTAIIGAQWGDEGKGKATDILAEHYDVIARACGGANAGHTIFVDGRKHIFHLLPSGCLHEGKTVVLGAGMVIHLPTLFQEIDTLKEVGVDIVPRLLISSSAHILLDYHKEIDGALEEKRGGEGIGTTKRGIGPAYMDKAERVGFRMESLMWDKKKLEEELKKRAEAIQERFSITVDVKNELTNLLKAKEFLSTRVSNTVYDLFSFLQDEQTILIEGAQATLLDIDHGTYPFVTSSGTTVTGALKSLGLPPQLITSCIGVAKAYCTRVGAGVFHTEVDGETADRLRERGGEYGSTTGRPRRCGWMDTSDLHYAALINGFTHLNITKLDVLDEEETVPVRIGEDEKGKSMFEDLPGWKTSTEGITDFDKLPEEAQDFMDFIEEQTGVPVSLIGTGQKREEMIIRN